MHIKSIKMASDVTSILCQIMPFYWNNVAQFFPIDPDSEVLHYYNKSSDSSKEV